MALGNDSALPVWEGIRLISDDVTLASTGVIKITAVLSYNFSVTRKDGFVKTQTSGRIAMLMEGWLSRVGEIREVQGRVLVGLALAIRV